jgi:hypothetical protein
MGLEEPEKTMLKKMLTEPPVKKIDLHFPLGLEVTARNLRGVTIKDALDAIYKQYRKKVCSSLSASSTPGLSILQPLSPRGMFSWLLKVGEEMICCNELC